MGPPRMPPAQPAAHSAAARIPAAAPRPVSPQVAPQVAPVVPGVAAAPVAPSPVTRPLAPALPGRDKPKIQWQVAGLKAVATFGRQGVGQGEFQQPRCIVVDPAKNLMIADTENGRVQVFDQTGRYLRMIRPNQAQESFRFPRAIAINQLNIIYVTDDLDFRIYKFDPHGRQIAVWKRVRTLDENPAIPGRLIVGPQGHLYLSEPNNHRVLIYDANEKLVGTCGREQGLQSPGGMAIDNKGNLLVLDFGSSSVHVFSPKGEVVKTVGKRGSGSGEFAVPRELVVDRFGNLFIADTLNHRIQVFDPDGNFVLAFGKKGSGFGEFNGPEGLALGDDDRLFVTDRGNGRVQVIAIQRG